MSDRPPPPPRQGRRLLTVLVGVVLLLAVLWRVGPERLGAQLRMLGPLLPLLLLLTGLRYGLQAAGWRAAMRAGLRPRWRTVFAAVVAGEAVGFGAWGPVSREPTKVLLLGPWVPPHEAIAAALAERGAFVLAAAGVALAAVALVGAGWWVLVGLATALGVAAASAVLMRRRRRGPSRWPAWGARSWSRVSRAVAGWNRSPAALLALGVAALGQEMLSVLEGYVLFAWIGAPATPTTAIVFEGLSRLANLAGQIVPGRVGVYEATSALLADAIALGGAAGVSVAIARRVRSFLWAAAAVPLLMFWRSRHVQPAAAG